MQDVAKRSNEEKTSNNWFIHTHVKTRFEIREGSRVLVGGGVEQTLPLTSQTQHVPRHNTQLAKTLEIRLIQLKAKCQT